MQYFTLANNLARMERREACHNGHFAQVYLENESPEMGKDIQTRDSDRYCMSQCVHMCDFFVTYLGMILDLQKSCKGKSSHTSLTIPYVFIYIY